MSGKEMEKPVSEAVKMAVINAWESCSGTPFPLYYNEAAAIGRAVIYAFLAETAAEHDRLEDVK